MQIIQYTKSVGANFIPLGTVTLEFSLEAMQNAVTTLNDEELERFVGQSFLRAFSAWQAQQNAVSDVEIKEENEQQHVADDTAVPA